MTVTTFGSFPGVKTLTSGSTVSGVAIGTEEYLVVFAEGNPADGSANVEDPTKIQSPRDAERKFGSDSELSEQIKDALENNANSDYLYGVILDSNWSNETFDATSSDTLANAPVVDDTDHIRFYDENEGVELTVNFVSSSPSATATNTVEIDESTGDWDADTSSDYTVDYQYQTEESDTGSTGVLGNAPIVEEAGSITEVRDTVGSQDLTVNFVHDSTPSAPSASDEININPHTGEWATNSTTDPDFDYVYSRWSDGFDSADQVVGEAETGVYQATTEAESVASTLSTKVDNLRDDYKLVQGLLGAEPNANDSDNDPDYDTGNYSDNIDNDAIYLAAPVRLDDSKVPILGALGGQFSGNGLDDRPKTVYNRALTGFEDDDSLEQKLTKTEANDLRNEEVIPVRDRGDFIIAANLSTSTDSDWERDFFTRRVVDRAILIAKEVGDDILGRINDEETRKFASDTIKSELENLVNDRLIRDNDPGQTRWYVDVYPDDTDDNLVHIDIGITPYGVVKRVENDITIDTS